MALGQNYLGGFYLGQGFAGSSAPSIVPYEGLWIYSTPTETLQSAAVTQFLELHGVDVIAQGSLVVTVSGGMTTWQALGEVDQPFVAPANVGWLRIPVTSTELSPTSEPGWANAAPITVSIYTDNAGVPDTLVASTVVPAEQVEAVQVSTWPEPDDLLFGVAISDTQASLPQLPGSGWTGITSLVAGAWGVMFATQSPNDTEMWVVPFDGAELGAWITGTTLPVSGIDQAIYAPNSQVIAVLSGGVLWAASFSQNGVVGSWQQLPSATPGSNLVGILTYEGSDYLVVVASSGLTYYASLSPSASVTTWTPGPSFPVSYTSGVAYQVGNDLVFIVQSGGSSTLVSSATPGGGWSVSGTLVASSSQVLGVVGQSILTTNGSVIDATALTALGTAPWSFPVPLDTIGSSVTLLVFETGTQYVIFWLPTTSGVVGFQQQVYVPSWMNVPVPLSLTSGNTYHLVLSASNSLTVGAAVPVASSASAIPGLLYNGTSWVSLGGVVPFLAFYGSGAPLALVASGKTTVLWFDIPSGALTTSIEIMGETSVSRAVTYSSGVISEVV